MARTVRNTRELAAGCAADAVRHHRYAYRSALSLLAATIAVASSLLPPRIATAGPNCPPFCFGPSSWTLQFPGAAGTSVGSALAAVPDGGLVVAGIHDPDGVGGPRIAIERLSPQLLPVVDWSIETAPPPSDDGPVYGLTVDDVKWLPAGGAVVVGTLHTKQANAPDGAVGKKIIWVQRIGADGSPDVGFGPSGLRYYGTSAAPLPGDFIALVPRLRATLQTDGKLLLAGAVTNQNPDQGLWSAAVLRLLPAGGVDPSFDGDGVAIVPPFGGEARAFDVAVDSSGRVLVVGNAFTPQSWGGFLARLHPDGTLDLDFTASDPDHVRHLDWQSAEIVKTDALGRILVGGASLTATKKYALTRLYANGVNDFSFDNDSRVVDNPFAANGDSPALSDLVIGGSNQVVAIAWPKWPTLSKPPASPLGFYAVFYDDEGQRDYSKGSKGVVRRSFPASYTHVYTAGAAVGSNGVVWSTGYVWGDAAVSAVGLARF